MSTQASLLKLDRRDLRKVVEALPESSPSVLLSSLDSAEAQVQQISNQIAELNAKLAYARSQIGAAKRQTAGAIVKQWTQDEISEAMWLALSRHGPAILAGRADRLAAQAYP